MSRIAAAWLQAESPPLRLPLRLRELRVMPWGQFFAEVLEEQDRFIETFVGSLASGDAWVLKGAFPSDFMRRLRAGTVDWTRSRPAAFHKMIEGCPDFHRVIDQEIGKRYSIACCKHSAYFYRWNDDPLGIWPTITGRWRVAKLAMGLSAFEYEDNTPLDGVVDRIQVVRYPPAIGYLEPHIDAHQHQRLFFSAYMSKRGADYQGGGFYFVDENDRAVEVEDRFDVGDVCIGYAGLLHGVAPCDRQKKPDWAAEDGRWFLSMYSNASDEVRHRHTAAPAKVNVPGVLP